MRKTLSLLLALILVVASFTGCKSEDKDKSSNTSTEAANGSAGVKDAKDINVVFVPKLTGNSFFESANVGAQDMAKQVGFSAKYDGNSVASVANQVQIINSAVNQGADAICISSTSLEGLNQSLKNAADAGVKIVTWDSDVTNEYRSLHVAQGTPDQLGEMLVEMAASQMTPEQVKDATFVFHYSSSTVTDQNSWVVAAKAYIAKTYPGWTAVAEPYYSEQDAEKAITVGESILSAYPDIDAILCPDSTALPGQAQAAKNLGVAGEVIITGFATPNSMRDFVKDGTVVKHGLWDCKVQGAMGTYLAYWLAAGNTFKVGDKIEIPGVGTVEVLPNTVLNPDAYTADDSGIVLMPERTVFDINNTDNFDF
ncbi:MAG: autoinducer 2-binding protein lsrB [Clostridiales bacterium]|jgi:AI-2 transport system substrate-binding protein|nr:autoinducer 2-binding protein lsrB [Clostridiales bacterium]